jgi:MFS family permease
MATGMVLIPLTDGFGSLVAVGLLLGFGNGLGSGIVMTLGSDFAPAVGRAEFLGVWRLVSDVGTAGGPLVVAAVEGAASLAAASTVVGAFGFVGAVLVALRMPEPLRRADQAAGAGGS